MRLMIDDNVVTQIIAYEAGELTEDKTVELFQKLVDSGMAWELQGHYGRMASALIDNGLVIPKDAKQEGECESHEWNYLGEGDEPTARQCKLCGYTEEY